MTERLSGFPQEPHALSNWVSKRLNGIEPDPIPYELRHIPPLPEDKIAETLLDPAVSPQSRRIIIDALGASFKDAIGSVGNAVDQAIIENSLSLLWRFSRIVDLSRPEELRELVVDTFKNSLEKPDEAADEAVDNSMFSLSVASLAYARRDNADDIELWKKAHEKPALKGVFIQAMLIIDPENITITEELKQALMSNPKDWAVRFIVRDVAKARGSEAVSKIIREIIDDDEAVRKRLQTILLYEYSDGSPDPLLKDLFEDAVGP